MSTKRAIVPFSQSIPLKTVGGLVDGKQTSMTFAANGSVSSNELLLTSDHGFGTLGFVINPTTSTVNMSVAIKYRIPGTSIYSANVTIGSVTGATAATGYYWRLDVKLTVNWMPNVPFVITFTETTSRGGTVNGVSGV